MQGIKFLLFFLTIGFFVFIFWIGERLDARREKAWEALSPEEQEAILRARQCEIKMRAKFPGEFHH